MLSSSSWRLSAILLMLLCWSAAAAGLDCSVCGRKITGRYLVSNGKVYCSQACFDKTLPRCSVCGKVIRGPYLSRDGRIFCSRECAAKLLPACAGCGRHSASGTIFKADKDYFYCSDCAALPRCFSCMLPAVRGKRLEDGRVICGNCAKEAIWSMKDAEALFNEVRRTMREKLDIWTSHRIQLRMVDLPSMQRRSPDYAPGTELGLYVYDATVKTVITPSLLPGGKEKVETFRSDVSYSIFFLAGTPCSKLIEVFAHELGHDWMTAYYPQVKSLRIREGFSEYCSWLINRVYGQEKMNRRIMENPDSIYGEGFRMIYKVAQEDGLSSVRRYLRRSH